MDSSRRRCSAHVIGRCVRDLPTLSLHHRSAARKRHVAEPLPLVRACPLSRLTGMTDQPARPHEHWHVDITCINVSGTFYYLCAVINGYSRYLVHWDIRPAMLEADIEVILQRATELHPGATPRIITDNGPQFIAKDFKEFIRVKGMTHVRTLPYYPQSNRRLERWNKTLKVCATRPRTPLSLDDARRIVEEFVNTYNKERLHSAIGYITPADKLAGREDAIFAERDRKLEDARALRAQR